MSTYRPCSKPRLNAAKPRLSPPAWPARVVCLLPLLLLWCPALDGQAFRFQPHSRSQYQQHLDARVLYEDPQGYLWLGGNRGLFRYDGEEYRAFVPRDPGVSDTITALGTGPDGQLWTGHEDGSICRRRGDSLTLFHPAEGLPRQRITGLLTDPDSVLWIATYGEGVYYYRQDRLYNYNRDDGLLRNEVYALARDGQGRLWAGTDLGINRCWLVEGEKHIDTLQTDFPADIVLSLQPDPRGGMWLGTYERGPVYWPGPGQPVQARPDSAAWPYGPVRALLPVGEEVWVATRSNGLLVLGRHDLQQRLHYVRSEGFPNHHVYDLHQDRAGNVWLCGEKVPLVSAYPYLSTVPMSGGSPLTGNIRSLLALPDGNYWLATDTALYEWEGYQAPPRRRLAAELRQSGGVISLHRDTYGTLWVGTFGGGLFCRPAGQASWTHFTEASGLPNGSILSLADDGQRLWLSTLGGVAHCPLPVAAKGRARFETLDRQATPTLDYVYQILADPDGTLWFATDGGGLVSRRSDGTFAAYSRAAGLSPVIYSMTLDEAGDLWFVTQDTLLYRRDRNGFHAYGQAQGLSGAAPASVLSDGQGHILVVHNAGLDLLDRQTETFAYFGAEWGLGNLDPDLNAYTRDAEGNLWLGTQKGLLRFVPPPAHLHTQPATRLDEVWVYLTERVDTSRHIFPYEDHHLSFTYTGLWYRQPEAVSYQYQLEGYGLGWVTTRDRKVSFPRLSPGAYTFRVRAALNQQFAQAGEVRYAFRIQRPFWQAIWFWVLVLLVLTALILGVTRARERNLRRQAHLEQEKIRFQFETLRSQVNPHFLFNSFNTLISLIEEQPGQAVAYVNQLSDLFRNMLAYREQDLIPLHEELKVLNTYFFLQKKRYGDSLHLTLDIPASQQDQQLPPLTLQLLIENAIKHNVIARSRPLTITVRVRPDGYLEVSNPRQAKRQAVASTHTGLQNIQARYQLLTRAPVQIEATAAQFTVAVPLIAASSQAPEA